MKKQKTRFLGIGAAALMALGLTAPSWAQDDLAFEADVGAAIDDGLQYLRDQDAFSSLSTNQRESRGLTLLALLEKRAGIDPGAPILGYSGAPASDQALMETAVQRIMEDTTWGVARTFFYAYSYGHNMMALSVYALTGGPEVANGPGFTLRTAMDKLVDLTVAAQGAAGTANEGIWGYTGPGDDSSTTQFAIAGLAAAKSYYLAEGDPDNRLADIDAALALARVGYADGANPDGGEGYQVRSAFYNARSSYQQTASALWVTLLGGADVNDAVAQGYLTWQQDNYNYETIIAAYNSWPRSYYYYMWSSSKAYTLIEDAGIATNAGNVGPDDLGTLPLAMITLDRPDWRLENRDFTTDEDARVGGNAGKYANYLAEEQKPRWYYDYAYTLMTQQDPSGRFTANSFRDNGQVAYNHFCWENLVCHSYALLVLQRALGGACVDSDGDGVCDPDDNCVQTPNPGQEDADQDGVGDVCDNCPQNANPDQADADDNGIGDVCEVVGECGPVTVRPKDSKNQLVWDPVAGAASYDILRSLDVGGPYAAIAMGHATDYATYLDSGLTNDTTYWYQVVAKDPNDGEICTSDPADGTPFARRRGRR